MAHLQKVSPLHLNVLGPPLLLRAGEPVTALRRTKSQALLFYLAVKGGPHRRATLSTLLWPESTDQQAATSLRTALSDLRKLFDDKLEVIGQTVSLSRAAFWLDTAQFDTLLQRTGDEATDILQLQAAVSLYNGDLLAGFHVPGAPDYEQWMAGERERLRHAMLSALLSLAAWHIQQHDMVASLEQLTRLLAIDPASEVGHRQKMVVLARMGLRSTALQQYETCRRVLAEELDVAPSPETMAVYELILSGAMGPQTAAGTETVHDSGTTTPARPHPVRAESPLAAQQPFIDWRDAPDHAAFYGRQKDVAQLGHWLTGDGASLVALSGMGGVGKTTLAVELIDHLPGGSYDLVFWRTLVNAPSLRSVLDSWLQAMAGQQLDQLPAGLDEKMAVLFAELQRQRCLLVLDNLESVMQSGVRTGTFRSGYEDYGQFIERMARSRHHSSLLLTTRDLPAGLLRMEEDDSRVRILTVGGLPAAAGLELLRQRGVVAPDHELRTLVERYSGNPLALKLVADTVRDLFGSDINAFFGDETPIFDDIRTVLDEQFSRLTPLEREVVTWLAVERSPVAVQVLWNDLARPAGRREFIETMRSLQYNSLVEDAVHDSADSPPRLTLQNVVMEYVTDRLVTAISSEIESGQFDWLHRFALVKAQSEEYVQESQRRLLLQPIAQWLVDRWGRTAAIDRLHTSLQQLRSQDASSASYAGANLLHLLLYLEADLNGLDLSNLPVWQADLRTVSVATVDFRGANLKGSRFFDTFGTLRTMSISPDGQYLATGGSDGRVFMWQMTDYQPYYIFTGHTQGISCVAWSPDGALLASGSLDRQVRLWDARTGQLVDTFQEHIQTVAAVAWSPDGAFLASAGADQTIFVRNWQTREMYRQLFEPAWINGIAFSPDGRILASVNNERQVTLWDWRSGERLQTLHGHTGKVHAVAFAPDSEVLATSGEDARICLWRPADLSAPVVLEGHSGWVLSLAFSPDGSKLASASTDRTARVWDVATGQLLRSLLGHTSWATAVTFSTDGATVISGGYDQSIRLWDIETGQTTHRLHGTLRWVGSAIFSRDGTLLASSGLDGPLRLWKLDQENLPGPGVAPTYTDKGGRLVHTMEGHRGAIRAVSFARSNGMIAAGCDDHHAYLWDAASGELKHILSGHRGMVRSIAFCDDDDTLITGSYDQTLRVWSAATGQLLRVLPDTDGTSEYAMSLSPDGTLLAHTTVDHAVNLIDMQSWQDVERLSLGHEQAMAVAFSTKTNLLACGAQEGSIWIWDVRPLASGGRARLRCKLLPTGQRILRLLFSPDDRWLAGYDEDDKVHIIDLDLEQVAFTITNAPGVHCLAFSRDSDALITGDLARNLVIHDTATGSVIRRLQGHIGQVTSIAASPSKDLLASSSADGSVRLWDLHDSHCLAALEPAGPYAGMKIAGVEGITNAQVATLVALGAVAG